MPANGNKIFISYSHKDKKWKDEIVQFLKAHGEWPEDQFDLWVDDRIKLGDDWFPEIEQAMKEARVALLLLTVNFLTSKFIRKEEMSALLNRRKTEGLRVIPIIVEPCPWESWPSLTKIQVWPNPERPLSKMKVPDRQQELTALAAEIASLLKGTREGPSPSVQADGSTRPPRNTGSVAPTSPPPSRALGLWKEKLAYLLAEEAVATGADEKFRLRHLIEDARQKIRELGGEP